MWGELLKHVKQFIRQVSAKNKIRMNKNNRANILHEDMSYHRLVFVSRPIIFFAPWIIGKARNHNSLSHLARVATGYKSSHLKSRETRDSLIRSCNDTSWNIRNPTCRKVLGRLPFYPHLPLYVGFLCLLLVLHDLSPVIFTNFSELFIEVMIMCNTPTPLSKHTHTYIQTIMFNILNMDVTVSII